MSIASRLLAGIAAALAITATPLAVGAAHAASFNVTIQGPASIFLAGRTDLAIPATNLPWGDGDPSTDDGMLRHGGNTPEEALEQLPPSVAVSGGQTVRVLDPAIGGINFFNGFGPPFFGPEGNPADSQLTSFGGVSGYHGTQGALAGVFLTDNIPLGVAPGTLDFSTPALRDFSSIAPLLGQVFFIGDGRNSANVFQQFIAPAGATRLFLGIPDGFGFNGVPGAYDDNDGSYRIVVGVDQIPSTVPLPAGFPLLASGLGGLMLLARHRNRKTRSAA